MVLNFQKQKLKLFILANNVDYIYIPTWQFTAQKLLWLT